MTNRYELGFGSIECYEHVFFSIIELLELHQRRDLGVYTGHFDFKMCTIHRCIAPHRYLLMIYEDS